MPITSFGVVIHGNISLSFHSNLEPTAVICFCIYCFMVYN